MNDQDLPTVDVREASRRLQASPQDPDAGPAPLLVDVREVDEFAALRVPGAVLLPISRFGAAYRRLPTDRPLLMLCRSGGRSGMATDFLLRAGYPEVHNIAGGILAWHHAGLPTHSGPAAPGEGDLPATGPAEA